MGHRDSDQPNGTSVEHFPERERLIDELYDWLEAHLSAEDNSAYATAVSLWNGDTVALDQSEGFPGLLRLTAEQFKELQRAWLSQGLPDDLYYPSRLRRVVAEPVQLHGGVVLRPTVYSPRKWAQRRPDPDE